MARNQREWAHGDRTRHRGGAQAKPSPGLGHPGRGSPLGTAPAKGVLTDDVSSHADRFHVLITEAESVAFGFVEWLVDGNRLIFETAFSSATALRRVSSKGDHRPEIM